MTRPTRSNLLLIGALCVAAAALVFVGSSFVHPLTALNEFQTLTWPHRFTMQDWRAHPTQRYQMAADLVNGTELRGKTQASVLRMLGEPSERYESSLFWHVPSPQRPQDDLIVFLESGKVVGWSLTPDRENGIQYR